MRPKLIFCLALVLSCGVSGCSTIKTNSTTNATSDEKVQLPIKLMGYRQVYTFMAEHNDYGSLPTDTETLFKLASDSKKSLVSLENKSLPCFYLIESHFYGDYHDEIRGVQGNGNYYILRPVASYKGFELVGIIAGNTWKLAGTDEKPQLVTTLHSSAFDAPESIYEWNGKFFECIK